LTKVIPGLQYFYEKHKILHVPKTYVMPHDPEVPEALWGFTLGKRVENIRMRGDFVSKHPGNLALLCSLGGDREELKFVWSLRDYVFEHQILPCLRYFKAKYGHLHVPRNYATPRDEPELDEHNWGYQLGFKVRGIKDPNKYDHVDGHPQRLAALTELGFPWDTQFDYSWDRVLYPALCWFRRRFGHLSIPQRYTCPTGEEATEQGLPRAAHGLTLGGRAHKIRDVGNFVRNNPVRMKQIQELDFEWSLSDFNFTRRILPAVHYWVATHGSLVITTAWRVSHVRVPVGAQGVPEEMWGFRMDELVNKFKNTGLHIKGRLDRFQALEAVARHARAKYEDEVLNKMERDGEARTMQADRPLPSWEVCGEAVLAQWGLKVALDEDAEATRERENSALRERRRELAKIRRDYKEQMRVELLKTGQSPAEDIAAAHPKAVNPQKRQRHRSDWLPPVKDGVMAGIEL